jgi:hypothetical protein
MREFDHASSIHVIGQTRGPEGTGNRPLPITPARYGSWRCVNGGHTSSNQYIPLLDLTSLRPVLDTRWIP